ncbi:hypothetical protein JQ581_13880 [Bradyrhizobium liaoningense]|uniref:hypothetical protein n=1 Tax=Bradyrhizobium liaoningense TaxID=43992 RepID=UPI001BAB1DFC|nr:hypothetical protein [Bradyrhizobium liaoningense]MBR0738017.1 hypothetical protein [Bradyrhizobium liaoningense]
MFDRGENASAQINSERANLPGWRRHPTRQATDGNNRNARANDCRSITRNCASGPGISGTSSQSRAYHQNLDGDANCRLRRNMKADQPDHRGNVIPFRTRSGDGGDRIDDVRSDDILRMLDLSKFERDRHAAENGASMRSNIAAMVLLGLLVFFATEDFSKLAQSNLCSHSSECRN